MSDQLATPVEFDETDLELLDAIQSDFSVSLETLSQRLGLSKSAVHYRINKLKDSGIVTGVTADIDPLTLALKMVTITDVFVTHERGYSEEIGGQIADVDGVEGVYYTMGDVDFTAVVRVQNRRQMNDIIDEIVLIDGVDKTSSRFVMDEIEVDTTYTANLRDEAYKSILGEDSS